MAVADQMVDSLSGGADQPALTSYEARAARAAGQLGLAATAIRALPFDLSILAEEGIFLDVTTTGSGLLSTTLDWQVLGIVVPPTARGLLRPPRCLLLPDRYRRPIEHVLGDAHALLRRYGFRFRVVEAILGTTSYRWVPATAIVAFHDRWATLQQQLTTAKQAVERDYDAIVDEVRAAFVQLATDSADRLRATAGAVPDDFDGRVMAAFERAMPARQALLSGLAITLDVGVFQLGSELVAEQQRTLAARQQLQLEQVQHQLKVQTVQAEMFAAEEARRREQAAAELIHQLRVQRERELVEQMVQAKLSPLAEAADQLAQEVGRVAVRVQAALHKNGGRLPASSRKQVLRLADYLRLMNFAGDQNLTALIGELERRARAVEATGRARPAPGANSAAATALSEIVADLVLYTREVVSFHGGRAAAVEI